MQLGQILDWLIAGCFGMRCIEINLRFGSPTELPVTPADLEVTAGRSQLAGLYISEICLPANLGLPGAIGPDFQSFEFKLPAKIPRCQNHQSHWSTWLGAQDEVGRTVDSQEFPVETLLIQPAWDNSRQPLGTSPANSFNEHLDVWVHLERPTSPEKLLQLGSL